jgi:hypothetical protein
MVGRWTESGELVEQVLLTGTRPWDVYGDASRLDPEQNRN